MAVKRVFKVDLSKVSNAERFCHTAEHTSGMEFDVHIGKYTVDGKSILGVLSVCSIGLLDVSVYANTHQDIDNFVGALKVQGIEVS